MISNIDEYIKLLNSDNLNDNNRTKNEELSSNVIFEVIQNHPERKSWNGSSKQGRGIVVPPEVQKRFNDLNAHRKAPKAICGVR